MPVRLSPQALDNISVNSERPTLAQAHANTFVKGSRGVAQVDYVDPWANVALVMATSVAAGNVQTGIALAGAASNGPPGVESFFGPGLAIDVPTLFAAGGKETLGTTPSIGQRPPSDGFFLTPSVTALRRKDKGLTIQCKLTAEHYSAGKRDWSYFYSAMPVVDFSADASKEVDKAEFTNGSSLCLNKVSRVFVDHIRGKNDKLYKNGVLMPTEGVGWKGMFYWDEKLDGYLRYEREFIEFYPTKKVASYKEN